MSFREVKQRFSTCDFCGREEECPPNKSMPVGWTWSAPNTEAYDPACWPRKDTCPNCRGKIDAFCASLKGGAA